MTQDKNKGITAITYNHLNLPVQVNKGASDYIIYTYDATGRKLTQQVFGSAPKVTDYIGELLFEGSTPVLKQISHSEGRVVPDGANWEYQYHLKDHLGNVRVTFTAKTQTAAASTANFEAATNTNFTNYFRTSFDLVDRTDAGTTYTHVQHLNGGVNGRVGIGKSISVLPGDKVSIEAHAKYFNAGSTSNTTSFITALATAFGTSSTATGELGKLYSGLNSYATAVPNGNHPDDDETAPKAFVTILLFDKDYNLVDAAWKQITTVGLQSSPTVKQPPHDYLFKEVTVREPGFAYVFVSNEHPTYVDVYFDDVTVTHTPSPIVSSSDYFAFGLQHTTGERAGMYEQRTLFQSQELQDELKIGWVQFKWRNHDPSIGRFFNVDPISEKYYYNSTYAFSENKVIAHIELEGLEAWDIKYSDGSKGKVYGPFKDQNSAETFADDQLIISPVIDPKITSGISSARIDPVTQDKIRPHTGVDIVKSEGPTGGAKVSAPLNGKISEKGSDSGRGNYVHLTAYKDGKIHRFYHMQDGSTDNVKTGDNISRGDEIGKIGNTGHSTGNHLHYEVRSKNGAVLNPINENPGLKNGSSSTKSVIRTPVEDKTSSLKFSTQLNVRQ